jgi:hypothetical protein
MSAYAILEATSLVLRSKTGIALPHNYRMKKSKNKIIFNIPINPVSLFYLKINNFKQEQKGSMLAY